MTQDVTCWTMIRGAAEGNGADRREFARRYGGVIEAYLRRRWAGSPLLQDVDDAAQEVFVECFREGGVLEKARIGGGFRAYLFGVVRNVARRFETARAKLRERRAPSGLDLAGLPSDEDSLATLFDREWALRIMREAASLLRDRASEGGEDAARRVRILDMRFRQGLPIRDIATIWEMDPARIHHEFARVRGEFAAALAEVVSFHHPGTAGEIRRECRRLLELLR